MHLRAEWFANHSRAAGPQVRMESLLLHGRFANRPQRAKSCWFFPKRFAVHVGMRSSIVRHSLRTSFEPARSNLQPKVYSKALPKILLHWRLTSND
ncbi:hypothetical protein AVEN_29414-1 [Araneus ventricosus]|uniref:Uncharacterized protein n=1 Tax=Araneus ventricosus TaxID=182803 RepID=A0A4Y2CZM5_ARAVE|nr:hypothetical protein AVEN_29414-1 [Araneus ventricosus]